MENNNGIQVNELKPKRNITLYIIVILILLGVAVYFGYLLLQKDKNYDNEENQTKGKDIIENEVKEQNDFSSYYDFKSVSNQVPEFKIIKDLNLLYLTKDLSFNSFDEGFIAENIPRNVKMIYAQAITKQSIDCFDSTNLEENRKDQCYYASDIKQNYINIFGPETTYTDGDIEESDCGYINKYFSENKTYELWGNCSPGEGADDWKALTKYKEYKKEKDFSYLYIYVQPYLVMHYNPYEENQIDKYYFFERQVKQNVSSIISYSEDGEVEGIRPITELEFNKLVSDNKFGQNKVTNVEKNKIDSEFEKLLSENKVDVYKYTFKKQSDGKYYIYSGNWE